MSQLLDQSTQVFVIFRESVGVTVDVFQERAISDKLEQ